MKKILACLLIVCLLVGLAPAAAAALSPTPMADDITSRPLRILYIGHSFAANATEFFYAVAQAEGLDTVVGLAYYSGCTLQQHVNFAKNNSAVYTYYKNKDSATRTLTPNQTLLHCIEDEPWDIIVMQTGTNADNVDTYQPHLDTLISYVDAHKTNPDAQYAWHMFWSFQAGFPSSSFTAEDQVTMFNGILSATQSIIVPKAEFKAILPTGPAIQTARSSFLGDNLNSDGQHLNDLGRLIAAYTTYCALTGKTLTELKHPYTATTAKESARVTEAQEKIIIESVNAAVQHPFEFTPSVYSLTPNVHWSWRASSDTAANTAALAGSSAVSMNASSIYASDGPSDFASYSMSSGADALFELADLAPLAASSCDAANLSMTYLYPSASPAESQAFLRSLQVKVSLDGETYLPDTASIRSATLVGGGTFDLGTDGLLFRLETDNLTDIPGVAADSVIRKVCVCPGADPFGVFTLQELAVNTYTSLTGFEMAVPADATAVQAVVAPLTENGDYFGGVHLAASSDEPLTGYTVTLHNVSFETDVFSKPVAVSGVTGVNFEDAALNAALGALEDSEYRIDVALTSASGTTVRSFPFSKGVIAPCMGNHTGRTALTQEYLSTLPAYQPSGTGPAWTLPAGSYYLPDDLVLTKSLRIPGGRNVTICLNGHTLRGALAADKDNRYYYNTFIYAAGEVTICDHVGTGKVQVNAENEVTNRTYVPGVLTIDGEVNLYSGSICDSRCKNGAVRVTGGTFNMYGGKITGNVNVPSTSGTSGGAVYLNEDGVFNLYDGEISGNGAAGTTGTLGAAVVTIASTEESPVSAVFNMYGGRITGNTALRGNVLINAGGTFNMTGGEITGNTSQQYGAVCVIGSAVAPAAAHMSAGLIDSNTCTSSTEQFGRGGGVYIGANGLFDFSGGTVSNNTAIAGGGIYLNSATASLETTYDAVISGNTATSALGIGGGGVAAVGGTLNLSGGQIVNNSAVHQGGGVAALDGTISVVNVRIKENTLTGAGALGGGMFLGSADPATAVRPKLTLVTGPYQPTTVAGDTAGKGSAIYLAHGDGEMLGGAITGTGSSVPALHLLNGSTFTMSDGAITGGTGVTAEGDGASLTVSGGTIGEKNAAGSVLFTGSSGALTGLFTGGTTYLPVTAGGDADFTVSLRSGDFAGVADGHKGVTVYGGRYASDANLVAAAADGCSISDSGDAYFKYAVQGVLPGDMNGDGLINAKDVVLLLRHIAGGYGVTLPAAKADLDHSGEITIADAVLLMRYLAGGYNVTLA